MAKPETKAEQDKRDEEIRLRKKRLFLNRVARHNAQMKGK